MSLPDKLIFDVIEDRIFAVLEAARIAQADIDPLVDFKLVQEFMTPLNKDDLPLVNLYFESDLSTRETTAKQHQGLDLNYVIEMFAYQPATASLSSDFLSAKRLFYLAAQIKTPLTALLKIDLGFDPGIISSRKFPVYQRLDSEQVNDDSEIMIAAGKFTFEIGTSFTADDIVSPDLEGVTVDTGLFKIDNTY